jgi:hypothetical protein
LVEIVDFSSVKASLGRVHLFQLGLFIVCVMNNFNLIVTINLYFAGVMSVFEMQHWSNSNCYLNPSPTSVAFALIPPWTSIPLIVD